MRILDGTRVIDLEIYLGSIIGIHGLNGHAFDAWAVKDTMWLRDLLPEQAPNARIMIYGYNSSLISDASQSRIQEHARLFVQTLQDLKRHEMVRSH